MLDKKSISVLKTLNKLAEGSAYKVITTEEILTNLPQRSQYDLDSIRQIMDFLEKQEYINIKFSEDTTFCYSLSPKARVYLEQDSGRLKQKKNRINLMSYVYTMIASFVGTMLALLIFFYLTF